MTDLYLKFDSEAQANEFLFDETGMALYDMAVDVIGVIHKPTGVMLQTDDGEVPEMAPIPGWHVNTRGEAPEALLPFNVAVTSPYRVWA